MIPESLYYTEDRNSPYPGGHYSSSEFLEKYKYNYHDDINEIGSSQEFSNLFIVLPVLSMVERHQGKKSTEWLKKFISLYDKFKKLVSGKIIIFDNHDYDYDPYPIIEFMKPDIILKRVFTQRRYKYKKIFSYPFIMCTINDPFYNILNKRELEQKKKNNKIIWSGTLFEHHEKIQNVCEEHTNRRSTLVRFMKKYKNLVDVKKVHYNQFLPLLNSYKYSLDLRGASRLNKRFFEILSTNSLILGEKIDVVWPFEDGDKFSEECFFEQGNVEDLYRIYKNFENDNNLYNRCLENQKFIVKKYFNKEWLWKYIENIIKNY